MKASQFLEELLVMEESGIDLEKVEIVVFDCDENGELSPSIGFDGGSIILRLYGSKE